MSVSLIFLKISFLSFEPPLSNTTEKYLGFSLFKISKIEFKNPIIALVSNPLNLFEGFYKSIISSEN